MISERDDLEDISAEPLATPATGPMTAARLGSTPGAIPPDAPEQVAAALRELLA